MMLNPFGVLCVYTLFGYVSQGFTLALYVEPLWGSFFGWWWCFLSGNLGFHPGLKCETPLGFSFPDPKGVLRLSPGCHPGIRTITHPTTHTLKGCNIPAPGFNPGIKIHPTPATTPDPKGVLRLSPGF